MVRPAEHTQQIEVGDFLDSIPGPHVAAGRVSTPRASITYSQIYWHDSQGRLVKKWPASSLNGNPDSRRGDWTGSGRTLCSGIGSRSGETVRVLFFPTRSTTCSTLPAKGRRTSLRSPLRG